jgi:tryptophan 2,3-dioxygenase
MELSPDIIDKLNKLKDKYDAMGQDVNSYLDGLLISNYLPYWDYIHIDTLLTLQNPKTDFPDENIFIVYHQITELYFKLCLHELEQIANNGRIVMPNGADEGWNKELNINFFIERAGRINRYFEALTKSFSIMVDGMEPEQFLRFRMALLPASGFQSAQYRMIEIGCTDFKNLIDKEFQNEFKNTSASFETMFEKIYWKKGAVELASGKKTLTLKQFEKKYSAKLISLAKEYESKNLWKKYLSLNEVDRKNSDLIQVLRQLDINVNVNWPLVHYKSAVRYLQKNSEDIAATGGTNWQKYLPPRFQKRIFYPELWTKEEIENWGKGWVEQTVFPASK